MKLAQARREYEQEGDFDVYVRVTQFQDKPDWIHIMLGDPIHTTLRTERGQSRQFKTLETACKTALSIKPGTDQVTVVFD